MNNRALASDWIKFASGVVTASLISFLSMDDMTWHSGIIRG